MKWEKKDRQMILMLKPIFLMLYLVTLFSFKLIEIDNRFHSGIVPSNSNIWLKVYFTLLNIFTCRSIGSSKSFSVICEVLVSPRIGYFPYSYWNIMAEKMAMEQRLAFLRKLLSNRSTQNRLHLIDFDMYDFFLSTGLANGSSIEPSKNSDQEQSFKEKIQLEHFKKVSLF